MNAAAVTLGGVGAIVLMTRASTREAFVTQAHRAAMATLETPILGVPLVDEAARLRAALRYSEVIRTLHGTRGFVVAGAKSYPKLTAADCRKLLERLLTAVRNGVGAGADPDRVATAYRATNLGLGWLGGLDVNDEVMERILKGESADPAPLTELGAAVLAAAKEHARVSWLPPSLALTPAEVQKVDRVAYELAVSMDDVGYLESGKPPADPTLIGGIAHAGHAVGKFAAGIAGDAIGGIASAVVGSPVLWFAALAFVAFKVLR